MRILRAFRLAIVACFFSCTFSIQLNAQTVSSCTNSDFELGNFSNWVAEIGSCCPISTFPAGITNGRHTIMSGGGFDPYSLGQIPVVCPGGTYSARLGNDQVNSEAEKLKFSFPVTANTSLFIYRYAVVLEDPSHTPAEQPRFQISVVDQNNQPVTCGSYNVVSGASIPGFFNNGDYRLKNWTTVGIELSSYIGQTVTIIFATGDCSLGGHFGYAYIDCYCSPLIITSDLCPGANVVNLDAPVGFASYLWSSGETTSAVTINNPVIGSTYTVTMTSVTGCVVTLSTAITPTYAIANFNTSNVCSNDAAFIDSSYSSSGAAITNWDWNFGDGTTSTEQYPVHAFPNPGNFLVTLIVENSIGCVDTIDRVISVQPVPDAEFAYTNVCNTDPLFLTDLSTIAIGNVNQWLWDFGDSSAVDTTQYPFHYYPVPGTYAVTLISTGMNGCVDTVSHALDVYPSPTATYSASDVCFNNPVEFHDLSVANAGFLTGWYWEFGDQAVSSAQDPVHMYTSAIPYTVKLVVVSNNGCTDTLIQEVKVHPIPTMQFNYTDVCIDDTTRFFDLSSVPWGTVSDREWLFGDGSPVSNSPQPKHRYAAPGRYDVRLRSISDFSCENATSNTVRVYKRPEPAFTSDVTEGCEPLDVNFADLTTVADGNVTSWSWEFGDGTGTSQLHHPLHVFENEGLYSVSLTSVSSYGCIDSLTRNQYILVHPRPEAGFNVNPESPTTMYPEVSLTDAFTGADHWMYFFGDGDFSDSNNPVHMYRAAGEYTLLQIVSNQFQCFDSVEKKIRVEHDFAIYVPNSFTPNGDGKNDFFIATGFEIQSYSISIFNRWGNLIYSSDDMSRSWDGKLNGIPIEEGIYVYSIVATDFFSLEHTFLGSVSLLR